MSQSYPTEIVKLPSKGLVYAKENPLSSGEIEMKYMTAREEDILSNQNYIKQGVVFDKLFQSMIVTKINYDDLTFGDKNAILIASRILGYGKNYPVKVKHPLTGVEEDVNIDLSELKDKEVDLTLFDNSSEVNYVLPNTRNEVTFKLLTHADEKMVEKELTALKKANLYSEVTIRLKQQIVAINGDRDKKSVRDFVDTMLAVDSIALRKYMKEVTPDVDLTFTFVGSDGHTQEGVDLPIGLSFFYPEL